MQTPLRLGLTGGIGSGKSTVAGMLAERGIPVVDADALARAATQPHGVAMEAIRQQFGSEFVDASGAMDRDRMRALVFTDPTAKKRLEAIIHPRVGQAIESEVRSAHHNGSRCVVLDIPLLVESAHWRAQLDRVLVVDCSGATQIRRVMQRNGLPEEQVRAIMAGQASRMQRLAAADAVIFNDAIELDTLRRLTHQWAQQFGL